MSKTKNTNVTEPFELNSIYGLFERGARLYPGHNIYRFNRTKEEEVQVTYDDYLVFLQKMILAFESIGAKGNKVIVMGETTVQWITSYVSTVSAGGVIVPLDPGLLEDEIVNFINLSEAKIVVYSKTYEKLFEERGNDLKTVEMFIETDKSTFTLTTEAEYEAKRYTSFNNILALGETLYKELENGFALPEQDIEKLSILLFTSGTTGTSKGVMLSQKNIIAVMKGIEPTLNILTKDDSVLSVLPVHHTYEMSAGILAPMLYGCTISISDGIKYVAKNIKQFQPTIMTLVPLFAQTLYKTIMRGVQKQGKEKTLKTGIRISNFLMKFKVDIRAKLFAQVLEALGGKLKYFVVGGAALDPALVDNYKSLGIHVSQGYGITECAPLISVIPLDDYNPTSCGKLMPGMQIMIDKENPEDKTGEIVVKGDNVMLGYYNAPEITAEVLNNGWFRTGDYGYVDKNGYVYITGRKKNIIIASNGKNVFPEEIEEYIEAIPFVEEVVVVGRDSKDGQVSIVAIVVPNEEECEKAGYVDDEIVYEVIKAEIDKINKKLVVYKHVDKIELRKEPFERNTSRKIKRFLIK
ncbi:MAG: AMP-binding protein [Clostridia bacterium]|nr:AMP-binding protein [Clostridia bacterium]